MTATVERIDFGELDIDLGDSGDPTPEDIELGNKLFVCAIVGDWLKWTPELYAFLCGEHRRIGRTLTEGEVYDLAMARPEFRGLVRGKPESE